MVDESMCVIRATMSSHKGVVINYRGGGRGGGHVKFYPYKKGAGGGKSLSHAEGGGGGTKGVEVLLTQELKV